MKLCMKIIQDYKICQHHYCKALQINNQVKATAPYISTETLFEFYRYVQCKKEKRLKQQIDSRGTAKPYCRGFSAITFCLSSVIRAPREPVMTEQTVFYLDILED